MQHLLLTDGMSSGKEVDIAPLDKLPSSPLESLETEWKTANQYFFRSMASVHQLRQICLNFHKDFSLDEVVHFNFNLTEGDKRVHLLCIRTFNVYASMNVF